MTVPDNLRLLSRSQVAELLGLSSRTVDRLVQAGDLPAVRISRRTRFLAQDVQALIRSRRTTG